MRGLLSAVLFIPALLAVGHVYAGDSDTLDNTKARARETQGTMYYYTTLYFDSPVETTTGKAVARR